MDFEEDRLALEAYIREKTNWRDEDEVSAEEWAYYVCEYMELHPMPGEFVINGREFIHYQRWDGQFVNYKTSLLAPFAWQPGKFWRGQKEGFANSAVAESFLKLCEYFGLIEERQYYPPDLATAED